MINFAFLILFAALFAFPPVLRGTKARHNAAVIWKPAGPLNSDRSTTAFAHVQERGEYRLHKLIGIVAGCLCAGLLLTFGWANFNSALICLVLAFMGDSLSRLIPAIDYAGHGAETIAAEKAGDTAYLTAEIARMSDDRDKQGDDVPAELARWHWLTALAFGRGSGNSRGSTPNGCAMLQHSTLSNNLAAAKAAAITVCSN